MEVKTLEDIFFQVYELGVQQTDCDLTKKANTIMMLTNQRVIEELESVLISHQLISGTLSPVDQIEGLISDVIERVNQLKQEA
jgi:hypothetical protein